MGSPHKDSKQTVCVCVCVCVCWTDLKPNKLMLKKGGGTGGRGCVMEADSSIFFKKSYI